MCCNKLDVDKLKKLPIDLKHLQFYREWCCNINDAVKLVSVNG